MRVLQLGPVDWSAKYELPHDMEWEFNEYPCPDKKKAKRGYDAVIVSGAFSLTTDNWQKLQYQVDPYHVCYLPTAREQLSADGQRFLKCSAATEINEEPQKFINHLPTRLFFGQSGIRFMPTFFQPLMDRLQSYAVLDQSHVQIEADTDGEWWNIGNYRQNIYIDPQKLMSYWLEMKTNGIQVRLRVYVQPSGGDGDVKDNFTVEMDSSLKEHTLPIQPSKYPRYASISLEIKGQGTLTLGILHSRWSREGYGIFIAGGQRIINPDNHEDLAYFFNPGDLRPPLNVYFSGARSAEGFEGFPLFRGLHAPMMLFTDMRQEAGQFYTTDYMEKGIKQAIQRALQQLGFQRSQLVMNGISMGTYPALKLGAQLGAGFINIAKPLANLGYIARRSRLQRPEEFTTSFDIDNRLVDQLDESHLRQLDQDFWKQFNQQDLSQTRLFVGYMLNDDYDNHAIDHLKKSPAIAKAQQFVYRGFPGRHNDSRQINQWFMRRLLQILNNDFSREKA